MDSASVAEMDGEASSNGKSKASKKAARPTKKVSPKKTTKKAIKKPSAEKLTDKADGGKHGGASRRPFPQTTLEDALQIPQAIKEKNGGKPWDAEHVAKACGLSKSTTRFFYLSASSRDYSLTTGSRNTGTIALADLGDAIVYPKSPELQQKAKADAFFSVPIFKGVYDHYDGGALPEKEYLSSTLLKVFGLEEKYHDEFADLYQKNVEYLKLSGKRPSQQVVRQGDEGSADDVTVVGQRKGKYAHDAFVVMPFGEKGNPPRPAGFFTEVLNSLITPSCNAADFGVQTALSHGSDLIHHTIINQLLEADLVIADLTDHNPNVLFELGIRIAKEKPILLIRAKGTSPIFDVDNLMRVYDYNPNLWKTTVEDDIKGMTAHIKGAWDGKEKNPSYMGILRTGQPTGTGLQPTHS